MKKVIVLFLSYLLCQTAFCGSVTIITHGYNSTTGDTNSWIWNMAFGIGDYEKRASEYGKSDTKTFYLMYFDGGVLKSKLIRSFGVEPKLNRSGDIIIALDWNPYSGDPFWYLELFRENKIKSTTEVSKIIADFLVTDSAFQGISGPITQYPLHLIGHSRGGSLVCEIGKKLGEYGIYVHQITTFDPHPINNDGNSGFLDSIASESIIDGSATNGISKNVVFADNYYQKNSSPVGSVVRGAANRDISSDLKYPIQKGSSYHSMTHFWYHLTLGEEFPTTSDGDNFITNNQRSKWFMPYETNGISAGYIYSYRGGQKLNFFSINGYDSDVINNFKFGAADGFPLYRSSPPFRTYGNRSVNVVLLESLNSDIQYYKPYDFGGPIEYTQTTRIGKSNLKYKLIYQADHINNTVNNQVSLYAFIDDDESILNDVFSIEKYTIPTTGVWSLTNVDIDYSNLVSKLKPGFYKVGVIIGEGIDARHFYSNQRIYVEPDAKIDVKYVKEQNSFGFTLYGTVGREYLFQRSFDLKNWEQIYSGTFTKFEENNPVGRDFITGTGIGAQTYWRLVYK